MFRNGSRRGVKPVRVESVRVVVAAVVDRGADIVRRSCAARRCLIVVFAVAVFAPPAFLAVAEAAGSRVASFSWFAAAPAPATWGHRALPPDAGILSYPATFVSGNDRDGISRERLDRHGTVLVYLDVSPKQGPEGLRDWPSYRLGVVRGESNDVHEDGHAFGLSFRGGRGSCVLDDYRTRVENHHYREIACFVQGRRYATVLIAAALESEWARAVKTLERAVDAYRVA
jgi:hypothetical protein